MAYLSSFVVGGLICVIGQLLIDYTKLTPARILVGYVVTGVFLTLIGVYEPIKKIGHAGATVPLTGFGYTLCKGVEKAISESGFVGIFSGGFSAAGAGIAAALVFGFLAAVIFKPHAK